MFRWKQIVGTTTVALISYVYSPLKEHALNYYAVRWYSGQDRAMRTASVRVRNLTSNAGLPVTVSVGGLGSKIIDFDYADPGDGPRLRYLDSARHSETLRQFDRSLRRPMLLDEHLASANLGDIEDELKVAAFDQSVPRGHRGPDLLAQMTFSNHLLWLEQCRMQSPAAHPCCMERAWEKWEYVLRGIQADEVGFWKQASGLQLEFSDFHFVPRANFVMALSVGHSALLDVWYGPEPVNGEIGVHSTEGPLLKVKTEPDLDRPVWQMFFLYWQPEYLYETAVAIFALCTVSLWAPLKYLSTHTLVNRALSKGDKMETAEEWEEVYGRVKFSLKDKFDSYRTGLGRPASAQTSEAIFDYLRSYLLLVYNGGLGKFQNERQMQIEINRALYTLAGI
jgi:hypothetical protein